MEKSSWNLAQFVKSCGIFTRDNEACEFEMFQVPLPGFPLTCDCFLARPSALLLCELLQQKQPVPAAPSVAGTEPGTY